MTTARQESALPPLAPIDFLAAGLVALVALPLFAFPFLGAFPAEMFAAFRTELPALTRIVLEPWAPPLGASFALALLVPALSRRVPTGVRRTFIVLSLLTALALFALCVVGAYLPIFELAAAARTG